MKSKFLRFLVVFLTLGLLSMQAQEKNVTGTVTDEAGIPLPGVSIFIKGTTSGTQTDFNGEYSLPASIGDILVFSYIGMTTQELTVGD